MNFIQVIREFKHVDEYTDFNQRNRRKWVEQVAAKLPANTRILDVGAGEGQYRHLFDHCHYEAQDFAQYTGVTKGVHAETWKYGELDYISDINSIPVPDASFDAILCTEVLEHVPEPIRAIQEMARILRPGGLLFISAPLGSGLHQVPHHYYGGYTPYFYKNMATRFGLEILDLQPNGGFFKHYLQESRRAGDLIIAKYYSSQYSLMRPIIKLIFLRLIPVLFYHLDDDYFIEEHTVEFFVTARKSEEK